MYYLELKRYNFLYYKLDGLDSGKVNWRKSRKNIEVKNIGIFLGKVIWRGVEWYKSLENM